MGQAKQRGTFEQRQAEAFDLIDLFSSKQEEHVKVLDKFEAESSAMSEDAAKQFIMSHWRYSGIHRRILRTTADVLPVGQNDEINSLTASE